MMRVKRGWMGKGGGQVTTNREDRLQPKVSVVGGHKKVWGRGYNVRVRDKETKTRNGAFLVFIFP